MNDSFQSPKIIILNYYDSLVQEVDIYSEKLLKKYSENDLLPPQPDPIVESRRDELKEPKTFGVEQINDPYYLQRYNYDNITDQIDVNVNVNVTPGQTRIRDYVNLMREKAIEKIRKVEEENLELYKSIRKIIDKHKPIEEQLFADKFCFLVEIDRLISKGIFNLFIVSTDFYLNKSEVQSLNEEMETSLELEFSKKQTFQVLFLGLLKEYIYSIWRSQKYAVKIIDIEKDKPLNIQQFSYLANNRFDFNLIDPDYYFSNIKSLTIRNRGFYGNRIVDLSSLQKLEYLTIEKFQLQLSKLYDVKNLIKLEIDSCHLVDLDETSLNNLSSLQVLKITDSIGYPKKPSLRIDLNHLVSLKWLEIHHFRISTLISKQGSNSLVYVKFIKCGLTTNILSSLFDLSELKHLEITEPKFSSSIVNWAIIVQLDKLEELSLKTANIKAIDFHFSQSLEYLDLSGNRLVELKEGVFSHLNRLKRLDLSRNQLNRLDENVFDGLENLEVLLMNKSGRIRSIGKDVFKGLSNLLELDLTENHIVEIDCEAFIHVPQLTKLVLLKNHLNLRRNSACFSVLKNLRDLILRFNNENEQQLWELERWAELY